MPAKTGLIPLAGAATAAIGSLIGQALKSCLSGVLLKVN
jgi:hypothetical protein